MKCDRCGVDGFGFHSCFDELLSRLVPEQSEERQALRRVFTDALTDLNQTREQLRKHQVALAAIRIARPRLAEVIDASLDLGGRQ